MARRLLGAEAVIGISVSNPDELARTDLRALRLYRYRAGVSTRTNRTPKQPADLSAWRRSSRSRQLPVVAIGGIDDAGAAECFAHGAAGVAVISYISRAENPRAHALRLGTVCACGPQPVLFLPLGR